MYRIGLDLRTRTLAAALCYTTLLSLIGPTATAAAAIPGHSRASVQSVAVATEHQATSATRLSAGPKAGTLSLPKGRSRSAELASVNELDASVGAAFKVSKVPKAGSVNVGLTIRKSKAGRSYRLVVRVTRKGITYLEVRRFGGSGVSGSRIGASKKLAIKVKAGKWYRIKGSIAGTSRVRASVKAWPAGGAEPAAWQINRTDSTSGRLTSSGAAGIWAYSTKSGSPVTVKFANLAVEPALGAPTDSAQDSKIVQDAMNRTFNGGWGSADLGGAYVTAPASQFSVDGAIGHVSVNPGQATLSALPSVQVKDLDSVTSFMLRQIPSTGTGVYLALDLRRSANGDAYRPTIRVSNTGAAYLELRRIRSSNQNVSTLAPAVKLPFTVAANKWYRLRVALSGSDEVVMSARAWPVDAEEPVGWNATATDASTERLAAAGGFGFWMYVSSSASKTRLSFDDVSLGIADEAPNVMPVAAFTSSVLDLSVSVDGSGSSDVDGNVASYAWDFGDGGVATGVTPPAHTYLKAGAYPITLTVTDDRGATATKKGTITVTAVVASRTRGAQLPISYALSSLTGPVIYVSTTGSDSNVGTSAAPVRTLPKAYALLPQTGGSIVVRGGTYPIAENAVTLAKPNTTLIAFPGEVPTFDGSIAAPTTAVTEGALRAVNYNPMKATNGEGMGYSQLQPATFSGSTPTREAAVSGWLCVTSASSYVAPTDTRTTSNPSGCASGTARVISGYFPDQVWRDGVPLRQVLLKTMVAPGTFWVERRSSTDAAPTATKLYLSALDAADLSKIRVSSSQGTFITVAGGASDSDGIRIEGIRVINHSPAWGTPAILVGNTPTNLDGLAIRNVSLESIASGNIKIAGSTKGLAYLPRGAVFDHLTIKNAGWTALVQYYNEGTVVSNSVFTQTDPHHEFTYTPQSGVIKLTKSDRTVVKNNLFDSNYGISVWYDQQNYDSAVARNTFVDNTGPAILFEISEKLLFIDNYVRMSKDLLPEAMEGMAVRIKASGGVSLVNNTLVGGRGALLVMPDNRSKKYDSNGDGIVDRYCAEHIWRYNQSGDPSSTCAVSYTSDFDRVRNGAYQADGVSLAGSSNQTPSMNWMPELSRLQNNVLVGPIASNQCAAVTPICIQNEVNWQGTRFSVPMKGVITSRAVIDGNVYSNGGGAITVYRTPTSVALDAPVNAEGAVKVTTITGLRAALRDYYGLSNPESAGKSGTEWVNGDGSPTQALINADSQAAPIPTDPAINVYLPAGLRHYGTTQAR